MSVPLSAPLTRFILSFVFLLMTFPTTVHAQTGIIKQVKDKKALVVFSDDMIAVGDNVKIVDEFDDFAAPQPTPRTRDHSLSWRYQYNEVKMELHGAEAKIKRGEFEFNYLRNFDRLEMGAGLSSGIEGTDNKDAETSALSLLAKINFIENKPGNNFVPYLGISLSSIRSSSEGVALSGSDTTFAIGILMFPLSEIFAIDIALIISNQGELKGDGPVTMKTKGSGTSIGWNIYF